MKQRKAAIIKAGNTQREGDFANFGGKFGWRQTLLCGLSASLAFASSAEAIWVGKNSSNADVTVDLKTSGPQNFNVLAIGTSNNVLSLGTGVFNGNIGDAHINPSLGGGSVNGSIFLGNGVDSSNLVGHGTINGTIFSNQTSLLTQPVSDAAAAATAALTIRSTIAQTTINDAWFGVNTSKTILGAATEGQTNVLKLSSINLTQGQTLVLKAGAANQKFLLEVTGSFNLSNSSSILVDSGNGLTPLDVLYALGSNTSLTATGTASRASVIDGIILASAGNINLSFGSVNGEVIGACDLVFGQTSTSSLSPVPEMSAFLPLLGLLTFATGRQMLTKRRAKASLAPA